MPDYPRLCPRCRELLGEEAFAVDRSKASGRKAHCKACDRARARSYYQEHRDERRARHETKRDAEALAAVRMRVEERRRVHERRVAKGLAHRARLYPSPGGMTESGAPLVVRTALVADAPSIAAIGRVAFPAVHNDVVGAEFAATVVEQTYSIEALTDCIARCSTAADAEFLVAERDGDVIGYLHYDSEGAEPELHRIYVDPGRKRGGVGSALMRELHARLPAGAQYILLVAEANKDALAFYGRHGLVIESRVDGPRHYGKTMAIETDVPPPEAAAFVMRFMPTGSR